MGHLVHLAGVSVRVANVVRQRCAWCGALIDEADLERIAFPAGDKNPYVDEEGIPTSRWRGLVALEEGNPTVKWAVDDPEDGKFPEDSCMALDPTVTG